MWWPQYAYSFSKSTKEVLSVQRVLDPKVVCPQSHDLRNVILNGTSQVRAGLKPINGTSRVRAGLKPIGLIAPN